MRLFAKLLGSSFRGSIPLVPVFKFYVASLMVKYKTVNLTDEGSNPSRHVQDIA